MEHAAIAARAEALARAAHLGQVDKAGHPYADHPARVAARVRGDAACEAAAWLHDVVEDTSVTLTELAAHFPREVVTAVDALTKRPGEPAENYYQRVAADPIARKVKLADLADNSDPARLTQLDGATQTRLAAKYVAGRARLQMPGVDTAFPVKRCSEPSDEICHD